MYDGRRERGGMVTMMLQRESSKTTQKLKEHDHNLPRRTDRRRWAETHDDGSA